MHPTVLRIRNRAAREALPLLLRPDVRDDLVRLGSDYGGWWVPAADVKPDVVAYCAGAGEDITFDLALHVAGCRVTTFDPTPRAIAHVEAVAPSDDRFRFLPVGWWSQKDTLRFYAPRDPAHVSHSALNLQATQDYFEAPVNTVAALMRELGDTRVDLIKMDIEGAEYEVIDSLLRDGPLPRTLCVEFDQPKPLRRTFKAVARLRAAGYDLVKMDRWNYTFTRQNGNVPLLSSNPHAKESGGSARPSY